MRWGRIVATVAGIAALAGAASASAAPPGSPLCNGSLDAPPGPYPAAPPLRFGITPAAQAGQLGPVPAAAVPEDESKTLAALNALRGDRAFVLRIHRIFWSDPGSLAVAEAVARRYSRAGFGLEFQLRYHPSADQEGDMAAWTAWVRAAVARLGRIRGTVGFQVTNEVNFPISQDSSDGGYSGARDALVQGVIAAHDEAVRLRLRGVGIGFNWFSRLDPQSEISFWRELGAKGGARLVGATDWVGLDSYPGTFFPPVEAPGGHRDGIANALSALRECFMPLAGLGRDTPIQIEENGWPTSPPVRSYAKQEEALRLMVGAAHDLRGVYGVSDYRWFDLRDADSGSPNFQQQYGLLRSDYAPKPAFAAYRELVAKLGAPAPVRKRHARAD